MTYAEFGFSDSVSIDVSKNDLALLVKKTNGEHHILVHYWEDTGQQFTLLQNFNSLDYLELAMYNKWSKSNIRLFSRKWGWLGRDYCVGSNFAQSSDFRSQSASHRSQLWDRNRRCILFQHWRLCVTGSHPGAFIVCSTECNSNFGS